MRRMAALLRQRRAPAEVMLDYVPRGGRLPRGAFPQTPRNASCPCGSGRRFKHCHGA